MKREKLFDAITDIRDPLIAQADRPRKHRIKWIAPVAAAAAVVLVVTAFCFPRSNPAVLAIAEAAYPVIPARPDYESYSNDEEYFQDLDAWAEQYAGYIRPLDEEIAESLQNFFEESVQQLLSGAGTENRACSPLNLYMALGLLTEVTDGTGRQQILELLSAEDRDALREQASAIWEAVYCNDDTKSILANSLWLRDDLSYHSELLTDLAQSYYASSYQGEMGSDAFNKALQNWLNEQTGQLLKDQVESITMNPETVVALASTVYFSTKWYDEFDPANTREQTFHAPDGDILCDFLREGHRDNGYYWSDKFSATSKSFDNGRSMYFLLPDEGVSMDELLQDENALRFIAGDLSAVHYKAMLVSLSLPKFDISSQLELTDELQALGVTEVFGQNADFSPLCEGDVTLSEVRHGVRVAIDEEGCVAGAYTVMIGDGAAEPPDKQIDFVLDRPFLFVIRDDNGLPLFVGIVNQP